LKPGGEAHLSIVAEGSLAHLSHLGLRVNGFQSLESLQAAFDTKDWQLFDVQLVPMTVYFQDLKTLLYSIKGVGASVQSYVQTENSSDADAHLGKLRGRRDWLALQQRAELFREAQGLPLTYQIAQFRVRRQGDRV
ncbi:MAG: malonyl-[acyl-carrier protein] O-methyltransferase BioC, partial [Shewanella sp.]